MSRAQTLLDKLWKAHEVLIREDGTSLLWVDRHLVHEGSHHAFAKLAAREGDMAAPDLTFAVVDHYAPTRGRAKIEDPQISRMIETLRGNAAAHGLKIFDLDDTTQGIVHVVGPEQGLTLPGLLVNCGDSHTSTHGAFGTLAFGIGATEVTHVLATQTVWQRKPKAMRITVNGTLTAGVSAKDIALNWIARLGTGGAQGHAIEYAGSAIEALSM
jgi:3-isopropylmalate/(R)-2-methylmalate dehydratase large subunit